MTRIVVRHDKTHWRLYTDTPGMGRLLPAGPRLRKSAAAGSAWPIKSFTFDTEAEAIQAAAELQQYIDKTEARLRANSQKRRKR